MNEHLIAELMSSFGMRFLGVRRRTGIPPWVASLVTTVGPREGRHGRTVSRSHPDSVEIFNRDWYALSSEAGLFSGEHQFLVSLNPGIDPDFDRAREAADDPEDPSWWECEWGAVELQDGWDLAGQGAASGVVGSGHGYPGFVMSSMNGSVFVVGTVWQEAIGVSVLPRPHCSSTLQEAARRYLAGRRTASEREDLVAWLTRGEDCPPRS